jgi:CPA1 family monovalent cation:H+ antiporter
MNSFGPLIALAAASAIWAAAAVLRRVAIPTPVVLVLAGVAIGFLPFVPDVSIEPRIVLLGLLPILVFQTAYSSSPRSILEEARTIALLAVGLVVVTAGGVALVAHAATGLSWPLALVLGTAVGPTDATAAVSIGRRLGLPRRLVTILEGEALLNDVTALVFYSAAVGWAVSGHSLGPATLGMLAYSAVVATGIGLAIGVLGRVIRRKLDDPPIEIVLTILLAYGAYLPAEAIGASGVLAAVVAGLYLGWYDSEVSSARVRLQSTVFWETLVFLIEAVLFTEVGLTLHAFSKHHDADIGQLVLACSAVAVVVVLLRVVWVMVTSQIPGSLRGSDRGSQRIDTQARQEHLVLSWAGMRGAITLAAVLAVPELATNGSRLVGRADVIYMAFAVIFATLVGQGLTLPTLVRRFAAPQDFDLAASEGDARAELARVALDELDREISSGPLSEGITSSVRSQLEARVRRIEQAFVSHEKPVDDLAIERSLRLRLVRAQRQRLAELRNERRVPIATLRAVEHDLDLEEAQLARWPGLPTRVPDTKTT